MEPYEPNLKMDALAFALGYHQNREGNPEDITETAAVFLNWLLYFDPTDNPIYFDPTNETN